MVSERRQGRGGKGREGKRDVAAVTSRVVESTGTYQFRGRKGRRHF